MEPDTIIPKTCIIGPATWEIEREVRAALQHQSDPGNGPRGRLFVPLSVRPSVLQWGHFSRLSCHPGAAHSLAFLRRRFWWPDMRTVSRLPPSKGMTVVLTAVDRFSKFARYLPLPKLPTAKETAELLVSVIFMIHGLPLDIVSDRGPQFTSAVWKSFCRAI